MHNYYMTLTCDYAGLYHAPRFLSDVEMKRAIDDELSATSDKQAKKTEKTKMPTEVVKWSKEFNVYPSVIPPVRETLSDVKVQEMLKDPMGAPLGPMQVCWGARGACGVDSVRLIIFHYFTVVLTLSPTDYYRTCI